MKCTEISEKEGWVPCQGGAASYDLLTLETVNLICKSLRKKLETGRSQCPVISFVPPEVNVVRRPWVGGGFRDPK